MPSTAKTYNLYTGELTVVASCSNKYELYNGKENSCRRYSALHISSDRFPSVYKAPIYLLLDDFFFVTVMYTSALNWLWCGFASEVCDRRVSQFHRLLSIGLDIREYRPITSGKTYCFSLVAARRRSLAIQCVRISPRIARDGRPGGLKTIKYNSFNDTNRYLLTKRVRKIRNDMAVAPCKPD